MDNLSELTYLLSCRDLNEDDVNDSVIAIRASDENEDFDWMDKDSEEPIDIERRQLAELENQLSDWFAVSDKIDELHEQIEEWLSDPPIEPFPYDRDFDTVQYFQWLDSQIAHRPSGSYELLNLESGWGDDNMHVVLVHRTDVPRILELCETLNIRLFPTTSLFD